MSYLERQGTILAFKAFASPFEGTGTLATAEEREIDLSGFFSAPLPGVPVDIKAEVRTVNDRAVIIAGVILPHLDAISLTTQEQRQAFWQALYGMHYQADAGAINDIAALARVRSDSPARVLELEPERLSELVHPETAARLRLSWSLIRNMSAFQDYVYANNMLGEGAPCGRANMRDIASRAYAAWGNRTSVAAFQADPYALLSAEGVTFSDYDPFVTETLGIVPGDPRRIAAGLTSTLRDAQTFNKAPAQTDEQFRRSAFRRLATPQMLIDERITELLDEAEPQIVRVPSAEGITRFALTSSYSTEHEISQRLAHLSRFPGILPRSDQVHALIDRHATRRLTPSQHEGAFNLLTEPVSVMYGGPGSGKTTVLETVWKVADSCGERQSLGAPSGCAAKRLSRAGPASTLHRLLGAKPGHDFLRNESLPLEVRALAIDESSQLDNQMALSVLRAMPDRPLAFIGDPAQLPSVDPGLFFASLIDSGCIPATHLEGNHRSVQEIDEFAAIVKSGDAERALAFLDYMNAERSAGRSAPIQFIETDYGDDYTLQALGHAMTVARKTAMPSELQFLTAAAKGTPISTIGANPFLQRIVNADGCRQAGLAGDGVMFHPGDRVLQHKNDYDLYVMNGDIGTVLVVRPEGLLVHFDGDAEPKLMARSKCRSRLTLAYGNTFDKAQGSEYLHVFTAVSFNRNILKMTDRNKLYTGFTRAKKTLTIAGPRTSLRVGIEQDRVVLRESCLATLIRAELGRLDIVTPRAPRAPRVAAL